MFHIKKSIHQRSSSEQTQPTALWDNQRMANNYAHNHIKYFQHGK